MSPREIIAWLKGSIVHIIVLVVGVVSAYVLVGKFTSGELSFGGSSLQEEVEAKQAKIKSLEEKLSLKQQELDKQARPDSKSSKLKDMKAELSELEASREVRKARMTSLGEALLQTEEMFAAYRARYRKHVREQAIGTKMDVLTTLEGKTYKNVEIKSIGALGLNITHNEGSRRIPYKELPQAMQDKYQFDAEEAEAQLKREAELRRQHWLGQIGGAGNGGDSSGSNPSPASRKQAIEELQREIRKMTEQIYALDAKIRDEKKKTTSRATQFEAQVKRLRAARAAKEGELKELRSKR